MAIPHDHDIQWGVARLLASAPNGTLHCTEVYRQLADEFPQLTWQERYLPYRTSRSKWANRVQFARQHLVDHGFILRPHASGRGFWTISEAGRRWVVDGRQLGEKLLRELDDL